MAPAAPASNEPETYKDHSSRELKDRPGQSGKDDADQSWMRAGANLSAGADVAFAVQTPGGQVHRVHGHEPSFTLRFRSEAAVLATIARGQMGLLEAYFDQQLDVDGDFGAALAAGLKASFGRRLNALAGVENRLHEWRHSNRTCTCKQR